MIKLVTLAALFIAGYLLLRGLVALSARLLGGGVGVFVHQAVSPVFLGFLAVASMWGIHQTLAQQYGTIWGAAILAVAVAAITLFALAGVRIRA
jgi:hypothetical protein